MIFIQTQARIWFQTIYTQIFMEHFWINCWLKDFFDIFLETFNIFWHSQDSSYLTKLSHISLHFLADIFDPSRETHLYLFFHLFSLKFELNKIEQIFELRAKKSSNFSQDLWTLYFSFTFECGSSKNLSTSALASSLAIWWFQIPSLVFFEASKFSSWVFIKDNYSTIIF